MTIAPSEASDEEVIYIGRVAHICAAAKGGPRFDEGMTEEARSGIGNGIFLCCNCADMVDDNQGADFPVPKLRQWKIEHEKWIINNLNKSVQGSGGHIEVTNLAVSHNQSGGITANQVNVGVQPRAIDESSVAPFLLEMQRFPRSGITIRAYFGDAECQNLSDAIKAVFERAGWTIKGHFYEIPNKPVRGVVLGVPRADEKSQSALVIWNWLRANNLKITAELVPDETGYVVFAGQNI